MPFQRLYYKHGLQVDAKLLIGECGREWRHIAEEIAVPKRIQFSAL